MLEAKRQIAAAVSVERYARRWLCRCAYLRLRSASLVIQSGIRYILAVQRLRHLKNAKASTVIQVFLILILLNSNFFNLSLSLSSSVLTCQVVELFHWIEIFIIVCKSQVILYL